MTAPASAPAYGTPDWHAWRRGGMGASEFAAALGLDPFRSEHELWRVKTGQVEPFAGNAKTRWGHRLERLGLEIWSEQRPGGPAQPNDEPIHDPRWPHLWATPDGIAEGPVGIEVKVTDAWIEPPERVRIQCLGQAGIGGFSRVDVVRIGFNADPAIYPIERDEGVITDLLDGVESWYVRHVVEGMEPPRRQGEVDADDRQVLLAGELHGVRRAIEALETRERLIREDLIASVAGQGVITGPGFRIDVTQARGAVRTGWKEVAWSHRERLIQAGVAASDLDTVEGLYQTVGNPQTRLTPHWDDEEDPT